MPAGRAAYNPSSIHARLVQSRESEDADRTRSHLDISSFTAAMLMTRTEGHIDAMRVAYGGVAPVVLRLPKTEEFLAGRPIALETFLRAGEIARGEVSPISDVRGTKEFRLQLAANVMQKFYYDACTG
jgi:xanthine dehydrogenase small subunit